MRIRRIAGVGHQRIASKAERSPNGAPVCPGAGRAIDFSVVPPLRWWRQLPADAFTPAHLGVLRRAIRGITIMGEPAWGDAAQGDAAAAVGVALRTVRRTATLEPVVDLVMSAVLIATLAGDPSAAMVLTTMIKRKAAKDEINRLMASWQLLESNGRRLVATAPDKDKPLVVDRTMPGA